MVICPGINLDSTYDVTRAFSGMQRGGEWEARTAVNGTCHPHASGDAVQGGKRSASQVYFTYI